MSVRVCAVDGAIHHRQPTIESMADSVCAGGKVERAVWTARPRTAGTVCSSWSVDVPMDFRLRRQRRPFFFARNGLFGKPVGLGLGRDHEPHYGRREGMERKPYDPLWSRAVGSP